MPNTASTTFSNLKIEPAIRPDLATLLNVKLPVSVNYTRGTLLGELIGTNSKQRLRPSTGANAITGGTYTITFGAQTTAAIAATAPAADIQAALELLSTILTGNVLVTGGPLMSGDVNIEFRGALANAAQGAITADATLLTSGGTAAITVSAAIQTGAAGTPGTFSRYVPGNTNGAQKPVAILPYDIQTDSSGNITFSSTSSQAGGEFGQSYPTVDVYIKGFFYTADLVQSGTAGGIDGEAVKNGSQLLLKMGTISSGIVELV